MGWDWPAARRACLKEARRVLRDPHDAEDAAQDALARAWRQRETCRTPEQPMGWLAQIARNEALRVLARRRTTLRRELPADDGADAGIDDPAVAATLDRLSYGQALGALSAQDRLIVHLRYVEDLTQPEISRLLDVPEGTVKVRLHRARKRLRGVLETPAG